MTLHRMARRFVHLFRLKLHDVQFLYAVHDLRRVK